MTRESLLKLNIAGEQIELLRLDASEGLSQPFHISLDFVSTLGEFNLLPHLGKPAMVESRRDGEHQRYFHGIITDCYLVGDMETGNNPRSKNAHHYRVTLQPMAYFHEQGKDYRIFQDMTILDIVKEVLNRRGIDFEENIHASSSFDLMRKYCVQFGESDMSFVYRLLEEHGLYYFYRHDKGKHVMVLCDNPSSHSEVPAGHLNYNPYSSSMANPGSQQRGHSDQYVTVWHEHLSSGAEAVATMRDYNFKKPKALRQADALEDPVHENDQVEVYVWPGRYFESGDGTKLASYLIESRRAQRVRYDGSTGYTGLQTGYTFTLEKHPVERFEASYLVISTHTSVSTEHAGGGGPGSGTTEVHFTAIPAETKFRAPIVTPRPVTRGLETAVVVGPGDEEIYVDKYGRVKVQFHWDRLGEMNECSSCWIRVSQTGGLGNVIHPRIGHEVLVDFINGDPDRPIVVGRVFNQDYLPVYDLPEHKTRAVWRSKTYQRDAGDELNDALSLDTGQPGANEIRLEDKTGEEEFFIHAERDMNRRVRYNDTLKVGKDQEIEIGKNRKEEVHENEDIKIGENRTEDVGKDEKITIGMNRTEVVQINETVTIHGNRELTIDGTDTQKIGKKLTIDCGDEIVITASKSITLKVGGSKIVIDESSIKASTIQFEATGSASSKLGGGMTTVEGTGTVTVQAPMVKIN